MARTPSAMVALGSPAPDFRLLDTTTGKQVSRDAIKGPVATVVMFICNHCPFVKHVISELVNLAGDYANRGIGFVAISANDAAQYPEDGPAKMKETALGLKFPFPYLYDETQEVAHAYGAACTPDLFVYEKNLVLVYRGQLDDSRPGNEIPVTGNDLRNALDCLLRGKPVPTLQKPAIGCNIKWKN